MNLEELKVVDADVAAAIEAEMDRQNSHIELIASENWVSDAVMEAQGSIMTNKYAEGYPGKRYYGGCQCVDVVENLAIERAKELFDAEYVNVQPHSGAQANMAVQFALLQPGDTVMGMNLDHGGHLTHGSPVNFSGTYFHIVPYGVNDEGFIDYDKVEEIAMECKPKMIIAGASAYARTIDFPRFREIADKCGAYLMVDMAHIAGLVAAGLHPSPIHYADVVTTTTHKTLRGPRGGMILVSKESYRQYQMYQEALGEWIHYDLDEDNHLVKKYSGAVIDKVTVNKMTKNILHEGMLLVRKAGAFVQKLGLQNETDFLTDSMGDNLGFQFMVLAAIYMDHGHWAVEFENGDSFYNLLEMCTMLRTVDEEDSADLLETFTLLKNEMEEQGMDILHIDHYNMLRNYIYTVADIYKIFFDAIQKKLETMVWEIDSLVDKNPDFIATEGKFKGCIFYQTDTDSNRVDVFDPSGNIMADFSIFQNEAIRNYEKTRLGIQGAVEHN